MKFAWWSRVGLSGVAGSTLLFGVSGVSGQEEEGVQTESRSAAIVIRAEQDGEGGPPKGVFMLSSETSDGGGGPVVRSFSLGDVGSGNMFVMGEEPGAFSFGSGMPMFDPNNWGSLLNIPEVRQELDIMDAQFSEITKARKEMESTLKAKIQEMVSGGFEPGQAKNVADIIREQRKAIDEQVREHLLPNQIQRLKEVALRMHMKQAGTVGLLEQKNVMEELGITKDQLDALKTKAKSLDEELRERVEALKKKAQEELVRELNPEQRKKLEAMLGKDFDYKAPEVQRSRVINNRTPAAGQERRFQIQRDR